MKKSIIVLLTVVLLASAESGRVNAVNKKFSKWTSGEPEPGGWFFGPGGGGGGSGFEWSNIWGNSGGGGYDYGGGHGGWAHDGTVRPTMVCSERGPCYQKKLTCPSKCFTSYSYSGENSGGGGGGGGCTFDCEKHCLAYC